MAFRSARFSRLISMKYRMSALKKVLRKIANELPIKPVHTLKKGLVQ